MLSNIFESIITDGTITLTSFAISTVGSLICGFFIAGLYMIKNHYTKSFLVTLIILPAVVQFVIMLVNGNIGAGVAVAGAFSLVRFRSAAGKGQEISSIFLSMAIGLATGMGYVGLAVVFTIVISVLMLILSAVKLGEKQVRVLKIEVPENLDYEGKFDEIFDKYLSGCELTNVKTTNMGSLFKLEYEVTFNKGVSVKEFIDRIREKNGNLEVSISRPVSNPEEL